MKKRNNKLIKIAIPFVAIFISSFFIPWTIVKAWIAPKPETVQEQVNDALTYGIDGIIVYVDQAGKEPAFYAAGWKDRENKVPANPHALFKIASISKLYIAAASAKLVNNQTLSLEKTLADYLPELKGKIENADRITFKMLLQHRSGIPNFTDQPDFPWDNLPKTNKEALDYALDKPADFEPDQKYRYSNTNYLLIGDIIDKALGYSHHQYIKEKILNPLGLNNTYSLLSEVNIDDVMSGYFVGYDKDIKYNNYIIPGGSMVATAQDVGIFLRALNNGTLLNENEQAIYSSVYVYEHTGLLPGFQSIARYFKDIDMVVIQLVNTSGGEMWSISEIIYQRIIKILRKNYSENETGSK